MPILGEERRVGACESLLVLGAHAKLLTIAHAVGGEERERDGFEAYIMTPVVRDPMSDGHC